MRLRLGEGDWGTAVMQEQRDKQWCVRAHRRRRCDLPSRRAQRGVVGGGEATRGIWGVPARPRRRDGQSSSRGAVCFGGSFLFGLLSSFRREGLLEGRGGRSGVGWPTTTEAVDRHSGAPLAPRLCRRRPRPRAPPHQLRHHVRHPGTSPSPSPCLVCLLCGEWPGPPCVVACWRVGISN